MSFRSPVLSANLCTNIRGGDFEAQEKIAQLEMQLSESREREFNLRKLNDSLASALKETENYKRVSGKREFEILIERHNDSMEEASKKFDEQRRVLQMENDSLRRRLNEVEEWRRSSCDENDKRMEAMRKDCLDKNSCIASLNQKIDQITHENHSIRAQLTEYNSIASNSYTNLRIQELSSEKSNLLSQVNSLNNRLSEITSAYESRTRLYDSKMNDLTNQLKLFCNEKEEAYRELESLRELLSMKEAEIGYYRQRAIRSHRSPTDGFEEKMFISSPYDSQCNSSFHIDKPIKNKLIHKTSVSTLNEVIGSPERRRKPQIALINLNEEPIETLETNLSIDTSIREKFLSPSSRVSQVKFKGNQGNSQATKVKKATPKKVQTSRNIKGKTNDANESGRKESHSSRSTLPSSTTHARTKSANISVSKTPKKSITKLIPQSKFSNNSPTKENSFNCQGTAVFGSIGNVECKNCQSKFTFPEFIQHSKNCTQQIPTKDINSNVVNEFVSILKEKNVPIEHHDDLITKFFQMNEMQGVQTKFQGKGKKLKLDFN